MDRYETILARMKKKFTDLAGYSPDDASDLGIRLRLLAGEIYSLGSAVDWLKRQTFAQTAGGTELEYRAQERGIARKTPVPAHGTLTFSRETTIWFDLPVSSGTVCSTTGTNPVRYVTTEDAVLKAGALSIEVPARAEEGGAGGNTEAATVTVMVTPPTAIQAVTNDTAFVGGEDEETDDALRARLLQSCAAASNGANAAYYRDYALSCDGVDSVSVVPRANGTGTVAIYLGGRGCAPADSIVQKVSDELNKVREICTSVSVSAAEIVPVNVTVSVAAKPGLDPTVVRGACETAVSKYFYGLGVSRQVVPSALNAMLFSTGMIEDCSFSIGAATIHSGELAVPGTVAVTVAQGG